MLVAGALTQAGSQLAPLLPHAQRAALITALEHGMQQSGGALQAIAPRYAAALRDGQTNWAAVQAALREIVSVRQSISASDDGVVENSPQRVEGARGTITQEIVATGRGRITGSSQTVIGGTPSSHPAPTPVSAPAPPRDEWHRETLIAQLTRRLQELEVSEARHGFTTRPEVLMELDAIRARLLQLNAQGGD